MSRTWVLAAAAVLLGGGSSLAADQDHYGAKVKVKIDTVVDGVRHRIRIQNKARTTEVVSMVVAGYEGFTDPPTHVVPPRGWQSRVVQWQGKDKKRFALVLTCDPDAWIDGTLTPLTGARSTRCVDAEGTSLSLQPQGYSEFELVLPYESAGLIDGRVRIVYADGRVLETPSQRSRVIGFPEQPGRKH